MATEDAAPGPSHLPAHLGYQTRWGERSGAGMLASTVFVPAARGQFISPENTQEDSEAAEPPKRRRRHDMFYNRAHFLPTYRFAVSMSSALFHSIIRLQAPTAFGENQNISCAAIFQLDLK